MINEFISFVQELFPSISPYTKERVRDAIKQFNIEGKKPNFLLYEPFKYLAQGDIIETLPFTRYDQEGNRQVYKTKGILISNTCDAENDDTVVFAPLLPLDLIKLEKANLVKNQNFRLLYLIDPKFEDYIVDLSLLNGYSKKLITDSIENGKMKKLSSLSQFGYYMFLCKLTIHLMRPEDLQVQDCRKVTVAG